jgi:hypothetical protein
MQGALEAIASWCSIAGVAAGLPGLAATYWQVHRARKEATEARERSAWGDMVKFINVRAEEGVAVVPFREMPFLPRIGERLTLPETPDGLKCGDYRVLDIHHVCFVDEDGTDDARLINVRIEVEPLQRDSLRSV